MLSRREASGEHGSATCDSMPTRGCCRVTACHTNRCANQIGRIMPWYSMYGTGATIHGIEHDLDGRVEFTVWLSVLWIPLVPISSWSARYAGELPPDGLRGEGHAFVDLAPIPHDWLRIIGTVARSICCALVAVAPTAYMLVRTNGRGATSVEMVIVFASALWCIGLIFYMEHLRKKKLQGR